MVGEKRGGGGSLRFASVSFGPGRTSAFVGINVAPDKERSRKGVGEGLHSYSNKAGVTLFPEIAPPTPRRQRDKVRGCKKRSV